MALINFTPTDSSSGAPGNAPYCSGRGNITSPLKSIATIGGTPGGAANITIPGSSTTLWGIMYKCVVGAGANWAAGTWTWRINVTGSNMNITLNEVHICRLNSSNVNQATIGNATGLGVSFGSTGLKSGTISGAAQSPSAGDFVLLLFVFTNGSMNDQSFTITRDQNIDSPFETAAIPISFGVINGA